MSVATPPDPSFSEDPRLREERLARRYRDGDARAREDLAVGFMPLACRLAGRYRRHGEAQEDLEQVAYLGLLKAIDRQTARCLTDACVEAAAAVTRPAG